MIFFFVLSDCYWGLRCQVRGIETVTTYDPSAREFIINTPCESAQKYWIGGAANVMTFLLAK